MTTFHSQKTTEEHIESIIENNKHDFDNMLQTLPEHILFIDQQLLKKELPMDFSDLVISLPLYQLYPILFSGLLEFAHDPIDVFEGIKAYFTDPDLYPQKDGEEVFRKWCTEYIDTHEALLQKYKKSLQSCIPLCGQ